MKTKIILSVSALALVLTGCLEKKDEAYYKLHLTEAHEKVTECRATPSNFDSNAECIAAYHADYITSEQWAKNFTMEQLKAEKKFCSEHAANLGDAWSCGSLEHALRIKIGVGTYIPATFKP
jgi:PBP1b-binding outer membrane lipoprotein LpoB